MTDLWTCPACTEWKQRAEAAEARANRLLAGLVQIVEYPETQPAPRVVRLYSENLLELAEKLLAENGG
jgi:hypothetical protein